MAIFVLTTTTTTTTTRPIICAGAISQKQCTMSCTIYENFPCKYICAGAISQKQCTMSCTIYENFPWIKNSPSQTWIPLYCRNNCGNNLWKIFINMVKVAISSMQSLTQLGQKICVTKFLPMRVGGEIGKNFYAYGSILVTRVSVYLRRTCCYHSALLVHTDAGNVMLVSIYQNLSSCCLW